jgi:hypothetical protein
MGKTSSTLPAVRFGWIAAVPLLLLGCNDHPLEKLDKVVRAANVTTLDLPAKTKIDFLFMIDDSGSMCEEQENLTRNFTTFSQFLAEELGDSADYRLAVITTDMLDPAASGHFLSKPAPAVAALNCLDANGQPKAPDTADCQDLIDPATGQLNFGPIIKSGTPEQGGNIVGNTAAEQEHDLEKKFRCLATLGTNGDGFEKGLEAMRLALSCDAHAPNRQFFGKCCNQDGTYDIACQYEPGAPDAPQFLRPDAILVVVFVTDENDCSDPASNPAASKKAICKYGPRDNDGDGLPDGYRDAKLCSGDQHACLQAECGNLSAADCYNQRCVIDRGANANCEWNRNVLTPVQDYFDSLVQLKADPRGQLVVATISGRRDYTPMGFEINYNPPERPSDATCDPTDPEHYNPDKPLDECCPMGHCEGEPQPSCTSENGTAFNGRRYQEFAELFGSSGVYCPQGKTEADADCVSICSGDFQHPLEVIKEKVAGITGQYCLAKRPACIVRRGPDGQPLDEPRACNTDAERADTNNYFVDVRRGCRQDEIGQNCRDLLAASCGNGGACAGSEGDLRIHYGRDEFTLATAAECPGGFKIVLRNPPPAGSQVFLEFQVDVSAPAATAADGGATPADAAGAEVDAGTDAGN